MQTAKDLVENATPDGECLICQLTPSKRYAYASARTAHRVVWEARNGPIPEGMLVCHSCDMTRCVNINHLFLGTPADNMADKVAKGRQTFGGPGRRMTLDRYSDVVELRYMGCTFEEIGVIYGTSRRSIARFLSECPHD